MDWIKRCAELQLWSSNFETFLISRLILSDKLAIIRNSMFGSQRVVYFETPKRQKFKVIFPRNESRMDVEFYGNKYQVLNEIYRIACNLKQDSLVLYSRICKAEEGKNLMEWLLKHPSKEVRLHIWELLKNDPNQAVEVVNESLNYYVEMKNVNFKDDTLKT